MQVVVELFRLGYLRLMHFMIASLKQFPVLARKKNGRILKATESLAGVRTSASAASPAPLSELPRAIHVPRAHRDRRPGPHPERFLERGGRGLPAGRAARPGGGVAGGTARRATPRARS